MCYTVFDNHTLVRFDEYFGYTDDEFKDLLEYYGLSKADTRKDGETLQVFCEALKARNAGEVEWLFNGYLGKTISIRDTFVRKPTKENLPSGTATAKGLKEPNPSVCFYHGILIGILGFKGDWYVKSNKESGQGYSDIPVEIEQERIGIVIEVKYAEKDKYDVSCKSALEQIERERYAEVLEDEMETILKYGIACHKKTCKLMVSKG